MADPAAYVGSVEFTDPLIWMRIPPKVMGADYDSIDGSIIMITPASISSEQRRAKLKFRWITWDQVEALRLMAAGRSTYSMRAEPSGTVYTIRFAAENGFDEGSLKHEEWTDEVSPELVEGYDTDIYGGVINVIILSEA